MRLVRARKLRNHFVPTVLPTARVAPALVFNTAFVVGALVLTFVVLVREERYARGAA